MFFCQITSPIWPGAILCARAILCAPTVRTVFGVGGMVCDSGHRWGGREVVGGNTMFFFGAGDLWEDSLLKAISMKVLY